MAANKIKGLTVEIGGDTTKLGKALESVNKKSRDLSTELGEINKMLKFDPGNADLLAQKQKVLAEAVENTAAKLKTLKEAEKQVQEQFERGEVSEDQLRALQREIMDTERKLNNYEKAARETADATNELGDDAGDATKDTKKLKKGSDDAGDSLEKLSDKADKAGKSGEGMGSKFASAAKGGLAAVTTAAAAVVGAMVGAAEGTREYRTEMGKLDTAFTTAGHSSEAASETYKTMQGILGETDQAVEASNHLAKLCKDEEELSKWTNIATGVYATFGDSLPVENITEAANETAKTGAIVGGLADALNWAGVSEDEFQAKLDACSSEQERQALITETLNGLYSDAAEKYRETNAEVIRANEANEAWVASMAEVGGAIEPILTDVKMMGASLLTEFVPGVKTAAEALRGVLNGEEGAAGALGDALGGIITQLLNKAVELAPTLVNVAMSLITSLTTTLISMLPQLVTTGVQVILAILDGLTQAIPQIVQAIVEMIPRLVDALVTGIPLLIQGAVQLLLAILDAIPQIIPPLVAALPTIIHAVIDGLLAAIPQLIDGAVQFLLAIVQAIPVIIQALVPEIPGIITAVIDGLIANMPALLDGAIQVLHAIVDAIPVIIDALIPEIPNIVNTIVNKLSEMAPVLFSAALTLLWELIKAIPQIVAALIKTLPSILKTIQNVLKGIPQILWSILSAALGKVGQWVGNMASKALEAGSKFITNVVNFFKQLPSKIWSFLSNAASKVVSWGSSLVAKGKAAVQKLVTAVVNKVKELPEKMKSAGKALTEGLWRGLSNSYTWLKNKIKNWVGDVTKFIKKLFGIASPSKETAWMGRMLSEGLAVGIEAEENTPLRAMRRLSEGMLDEADNLNGVTLERRLNHTFAAPNVQSMEGGMLDKLDKILAAIERGQILTIDGKTLIGSTVGDYDAAMGQRRALAARGAL